MSEPGNQLTFEEYARDRENARFTEWLRERSEPAFKNAATHQFTRELGDDTLDEASFKHYIVQDYAFVEGWVGTLGYAIGQAPTMAAKSRIIDLLAVLTSKENDCFERTFDRLEVPETEWTDITPSPAIQSFLEHMASGALQNGYVETLALVLAEEWIYFTWSRDVETASDARRPHYDEWIDHHTDPWLADWLSWLREELDHYGPSLSPHQQRRASALFGRTAELEAMFFQEALDVAETE